MSDADKRTPREVQHETQEELDVIELTRTPRDEKRAREQAVGEGAHEVHLEERQFRPAKPNPIEAIRRKVDALQIRRRQLPQPKPAPSSHSDADATSVPPPRDATPEARLSPSERDALQAAVGGTIIRVETLYLTDAGHAVAVVVEHKGARATRKFILHDGAARSLDDVTRAVDALPAPVAPASPDVSSGAGKGSEEGPGATGDSAPKKRFGFGRRKS